MPGYQQIDYNQGWGNAHDERLRQNIDIVFQKYDMNQTYQLEGQEFFYAYRDLTLAMGMAPPSSYQEIWQAAMECDQNRDGQVNKMEMFNLFKRIQGINQGQFFGGGMGMGGMGGGMQQYY